MTRDRFRSLGGIVGVTAGMVVMVLLEFGGLIAGFCFGAGGAVLGGMTGEHLHESLQKRGRS